MRGSLESLRAALTGVSTSSCLGSPQTGFVLARLGFDACYEPYISTTAGQPQGLHHPERMMLEFLLGSWGLPGWALRCECPLHQAPGQGASPLQTSVTCKEGGRRIVEHSITWKGNPVLISSHTPPAPDNHESTLCLCGFACFGCFPSTESHWVAFCVWLLSLSIVFSSSSMCVNDSFLFMAEYYSSVWICHILSIRHLLMDI